MIVRVESVSEPLPHLPSPHFTPQPGGFPFPFLNHALEKKATCHSLHRSSASLSLLAMAGHPLLIAAVFASALFVIYNVFFGKNSPQRKGARVPPGPPGKPLIGNLLDIPPSHSWLKFKEWADE